MATKQTVTATVTSHELYYAHRTLSYREQVKLLKNARDNGGLILSISLRAATATDVSAELLNQANQLKAAEKKVKQEAEPVTESVTETPKLAPVKEIKLLHEIKLELAPEEVTEPEARQVEIVPTPPLLLI